MFCMASSIILRARMAIPLPLSAAPTSHGAGWDSVRFQTSSSISKPAMKMTESLSFAGSTIYGTMKPSPVCPTIARLASQEPGAPGGCPGSRSEGRFLNLLELSKRVASETAYHGEIWPVRGLVIVAVLACSDGSLMDDQMRGISAEVEQLDSAGGDSGPAGCRRLEAGNGGAVREARVRSQL